MTYKDKVSLILNKHPETAYSRSEFFKCYIKEFIIGKDVPFLTWADFDKFWLEFSSAERELREQIKGRLPVEADKSRYLKSAKFRAEYKVAL